MASPLISNVSRVHSFGVIGRGQRISSFPALLFTQGEAPMINKIDATVDVETLTNVSGIAPMISRMAGIDKDGKIILPSESAVSEYIYGLTGRECAVPASYKNKRCPGEALYPNSTGDEVALMRMDWALSNVLSKSQRDCIRQINVGIWETFTTASMAIEDEHEGSKSLVWPRNATLKNRTVETIWATHASAEPWTDLGDAVKEIRKKGTAVGMYKAMAIMGSNSFDDLTEIYRNQRAQEVEPQLFNSYKFSEAEMPADFKFLAGSGLDYGGWVNVKGSNTKVHLFTCDDFYTNEAGTVVDMVDADSVTVCLYNPFDYKMFYGPGKRLAGADDAFYKRLYATRPALAENEIPIEAEYTDSGVNVNAIEITLFDQGKAQGVGGAVEVAYLPALMNANTVATLDVKTATT